MTDQITTPAQMREADYCPFCGGMTETDFYQPYRSIGGKLGKACAIYCLDCSANMTICHEDHPGVDLEHLMSALVTEWNRRAMPEAEPEPQAVNAVMCAAERDAQSRDAVDLTLFRQAIRSEALEEAAKYHGNFLMTQTSLPVEKIVCSEEAIRALIEKEPNE